MRIRDWSSDVCSSDLERDKGSIEKVVDHINHIAIPRIDQQRIVIIANPAHRPVCRRETIIIWVVNPVIAGKKQIVQVNADGIATIAVVPSARSEEHTSELQSLMRISYAVFCLKKKTTNTTRSQN